MPQIVPTLAAGRARRRRRRGLDHGGVTSRDLAWFRALYRRASDPATVPQSWTEDVEIQQSPDVPGTAGTFRGHAGVVALGMELAEGYNDIVWDPREVHELGPDRYLVLVMASGTGVVSGASIAGEVGHVLTIRDDRIAFMKAYLGWDAARAAAGLR